jgi:trehalose-6-phosphatase
MLAANVVGFHLFEYARHFMTSCRRLLGLGENVGTGPAGGVLSINLVTRSVTITVSHVGIDRDVTLHRLRQADVESKLSVLKARCNPSNRKVIGGVEMLNPLQGASLKLLAYEELLKNYPMWRSRLVMVQVCMPDPARAETSHAMSTEMRATAARIHAAYGPESLHYLELGVELEAWTVNDRLALFRLCDMYLNCAMRDGLNLLPFEYVLTKSSQQPTSDGIAVLSEFVGCSHVLNGAIRINPFNLEHVVEQMDLTLAMNPQERAARLAKDYNFVRTHSTATWLKVAVNDMRRVRSSIVSTSPAARPTTCLSTWPRGPRPGDALPAMNPEQIARAYSAATRRVILLGLDGTLIRQEHVIEHMKLFHDFQGYSAQPDATVLDSLSALAADPANVVYVLSGRSPSDMFATLGRVGGVGLAAELGYMHLPPWHRPMEVDGDLNVSRLHVDSGASELSGGSPAQWRGGAARDSANESQDSGYGDADEDDEDDDEYGVSSPHYAAAAATKSPPPVPSGGAAGWNGARGGVGASPVRGPSSDAIASGWSTLLQELPPVASNWRDAACKVMVEYTVRTNGAYERSHSSAVHWCYHDADPDFGLMQARFLTAALREKLSGCGVTITHQHEKGRVEVRLAGVNKGAAADLLLSAADALAPVDFLLAIGDDDDDEFMLSATTARACAPGMRERLRSRLFTISVGHRETSHAQCVASNATEVLALLETLRTDQSNNTSAACTPTRSGGGAFRASLNPPPSPLSARSLPGPHSK